MRLVIVGGSGAGKSTQAQRLCRHFELPLISTSEIVQEVSKSHSDFNYNALSLSVTRIIPEQMMIEFIHTKLLESVANTGWILEGYPHTVFGAEQLDILLEKLGQKLDWAIYLQVPEAVMVSRQEGRFLPDDQPEIVQRRVELFYDRTIPILEYYDRRRRLLTINGDQSPELVQQNIINLLSTAN